MTTLADLPRLADFNTERPENLGWSARDPERNAALLAPFSFNGVTFGPMHVDVHTLFTAFLTELVPLIPGGLVAGQCGCYNQASVTVSGKRSFHTYAIAIDINWGSNPMNTPRRTGPHTMPAAVLALARKYGMISGGEWTNPVDWMHVEVHLTPAQARSFTPPAPPTPKDWLDMATEAQVKKIVTDALNDRFRWWGPRMLLLLRKGATNAGYTAVQAGNGLVDGKGGLDGLIGRSGLEYVVFRDAPQAQNPVAIYTFNGSHLLWVTPSDYLALGQPPAKNVPHATSHVFKAPIVPGTPDPRKGEAA